MNLKPALISSVCFALMTLSGCTHALHNYHVGDYEPVSKKANASRVSAKAEQSVFLGFASETDYVNEAYALLQKKCPKGRITGINTRYSTSHGFFSWTNTVRMIGTCVQ